jgi:hypothetical protein
MNKLFKIIVFIGIVLIVFSTVFGMFMPDIISSRMPTMMIFPLIIIQLIMVIYALEFIGSKILKLWKYD